MKRLILLLSICFSNSTFAQSPFLGLNLLMDTANAGDNRYKIVMKICKSVNESPVKDYFKNENSKIDFQKLTDKDVSCGEYISSYDNQKEYDSYQYSNQLFAWEKILVWKIVNESPYARVLPMFVILPVKTKSFITSVSIKNIEFQPGKTIWIDEKGKINKKHVQKISVNLKNKEGIATKLCTLNEILD